MKFAVNIAKNIIITALVVLSVYQVYLLWLEGRGFMDVFSGFISITDAGSVSQSQSAIKPYRLFFGENGQYTAITGSLREPKSEQNLTQALKQSMDGVWRANITDYSFVYEKRALLIEFAVDMPAEVFNEVLTGKPGSLNQRIKSFDMIAVIPEQSQITCVYINRRNRTAVSSTVTKSVKPDNISQIIDSMFVPESGALLYTVSSFLNDSCLYAPDIFVANWDGRLDYLGVSVYNPFAEEGDIKISSIEKQIDVFFDPPASKVFSGTMPYKFSNDTIVVKYLGTNVLEYTCHKSMPKKENSFIANYSAAMQLLARDSSLINDYHLAHIEFTGSEWVFGFDYTIGGFPLAMSMNTKEDTGMNHMLELTVSNALVTKYNRYVLTFALDISYARTAGRNYLRTIEGILSMNGEPDPENHLIDSFDICYKIDINSPLGLYWNLISAEGASNMQSAE